MNVSKVSTFCVVLLLVWLAGCAPLSPRSVKSSVLTQHNNSMRTGAYLLEKQLTPATVATGMQLRYSRPVNGVLTAQLLYAHGVRINSKRLNVIYAFTEENAVYAYDADEERDAGTPRGLIWSRSLPVTPNPQLPFAAHGPQTGGILSTPVIDESSGKLYLVYSISNGLWPQGGTGDGSPRSPLYEVEYHLAALDLRSGAVLQDQVVSGSVSSSVGRVDFVPRRQTQRTGLLLLRNPLKSNERTIYVAFGGRFLENTHNYHGWLMGYDAKTFAPRGVFCSTPGRLVNDEGGGIWQGGGGLGGDDNGNVYFNTGNGPASGNDHGNSIVKLAPVLRAGNYDFDVQAFSAEADDTAHVNEWKFHDIDLGGGGITLIPDSSRLVSGGKTGVLYLMDRPAMKKVLSFEAASVNPANDPDPEGARFRDCCHGPHLHGAWTYWAVSPTRGYLYHWAEKDFLRRFDYDPTTGQVNPASVATGDVLAKPYAVMPGGLISLSANGNNDGLLWVTLPWDGGTGRIMAFDALTLRRVWDTTAPAGAAASHNGPPTVADGKVIVGTMNGSFLVYAPATSPAGAPTAPTLATAATPRAAAQASTSAPREPILPTVPDPGPWIREYLGRLAPDKAAVLTPPKGHRPLFLATGEASPPDASGSLIYEVKRVDAAASFQWVLVGVSGELHDDSGVMPHLMYRGLGQVLATAQPGLAWKTTEGGLVRWSVEASVNAPPAPGATEIHDAPWMLFHSAPSDGHHLLDQVTYVQLLGTVGGEPPASVGQMGDRVQVPYTGRYVFYVRDRSAQSTNTPSP